MFMSFFGTAFAEVAPAAVATEAASVSPVLSLVVTFAPLLILLHAGLGFPTQFMGRARGYRCCYFLGLFLGVIGIIIVACLPRRERNKQVETGLYACMQPADDPAAAGAVPAEAVGHASGPDREDTAVPAGDDVALLKKLSALHEEGILTDQEYETKKAEILKRM